MMPTAHLIYFSPTGTTRKVSLGIAEGLGAERVIQYDVTMQGARFETVLTDGIAVIGAPVYAGRVPELFLKRLPGIASKGVPAVLVALYGNRDFEDALVELRDVSVAMGFNVIAAGAFIGEHSYSTPSQPIASGRPDVTDLAAAVMFGRQVAQKIAQNACDTPKIDGNVPYKERVPIGGIAPETDNKACILCGTCAEVCPSGVVTVSASVTTHAANCIMCCSCVKSCGFQARSFRHPRIEERRLMLQRNCSLPKAPATFL